MSSAVRSVLETTRTVRLNPVHVATKYYYPVVLGYGTGTGPDANDSPLHTPNAVMVVQNITSCSLMVLL